MTVYLLNGSPRKRGNTATLLDEAARGVESESIGAERIDLYGLDFKGCVSCFACKRLGGASFGRCARRDGLTPVLEKLKNADGIVFGSPIYLLNISSGMQALRERLLFPAVAYRDDLRTHWPRLITTGFIYTMNMSEEQAHDAGVERNVKAGQSFAERCLGVRPETLFSYDTYQFNDYSRYESSKFSESEKARHRRERFPEDKSQAFEMGARIARAARGRE